MVSTIYGRKHGRVLDILVLETHACAGWPKFCPKIDAETREFKKFLNLPRHFCLSANA